MNSLLQETESLSHGDRQMPGRRTSIPPDVANAVPFAFDETCCRCRIKRLDVQIHHINGDPSNHSFENLAVLCLQCHTDTQVTGGFVRRLTPGLVALNRDAWITAVRDRRNQLAISRDQIRDIRSPDEVLAQAMSASRAGTGSSIASSDRDPTRSCSRTPSISIGQQTSCP